MTNASSIEPAPSPEFPDLDAAFAEHGSLSLALPGFRVRAGQIEYARAVARAVAERGILVAEAGTGTGKTIAYLLAALMHGERILIATATRNLQDQLFRKDLPIARDALGLTGKSAQLKGRANYLCLQRMEEALTQGHLPSRSAVQDLQRVQRFAEVTTSGDFATLSDVPEHSGVWPFVTSTRENCLGRDCPRFKQCFVMQARREAMEADIVVTNHHLFFADMALRGSDMAELLPNADVVILDEAHQIPRTATQFLAARVSTLQLQDFARDLQVAGLLHAHGQAPWQELADQLGNRARDLRLALPREARQLKLLPTLELPGFSEAAQATLQQVQRTQQALEPFEELAPEFPSLARRLQEWQSTLQDWMTPPSNPSQDETTKTASGAVRWLDLTARNATFVSAPLRVAEHMLPLLRDEGRAWILTSATLSAGGSFRFFAQELGLMHEEIKARSRGVQVKSPFDYASQALLYVPRPFPPPNPSEPFQLAVAELAARLITRNHGGAMVLTTTRRAINVIASRLRESLPEHFGVLEQGEESNAVLLSRFASRPHMVLVGSHAFWEGVDLAGDLLTLVIIDKLPIAPPDDAMVEARCRDIEARGGSGFRDYSIPQAALTLKQGVGRLIRSESDRGVMVVCDHRMTHAGWGQQFLRSLPPFRLSHQEDDALAFLDGMRDMEGEAGEADAS